MSLALSEGERWGDMDKRKQHSKKMIGDNNPMFGVQKTHDSIEKYKNTQLLKQEKWGFLGSVKHHRTQFLKVLSEIARYGLTTSARSLKTVEIENFKYCLSPYVRFCNFGARKLNINYIKKEFLWYLRGDRFDLSILEHAKMWNNLIQADNGINSNYGQYIFNKDCDQFNRVFEILKNDKDSRRATIIILQPKHVLTETTDQPCTYCIRFSIRDNKLGMTVHMRSQDAIFGMGNDAPCFSFIHEMLFVKLRDVYPELEYGIYTHFADSLHVYERHFEMLNDIVNIDVMKEERIFRRRKTNSEKRTKSVGAGVYYPVLCPKIKSSEEVDFLIAGNFQNIPEDFEFSKWLKDN